MLQRVIILGTMKAMRRQTVIKFIMVFLLLFEMSKGAIGYCQDSESEKNAKVIKGTIAGCDWVGGKIVVRTDDLGAPDEIVFGVSQDTVIVKGTQDISLADMHMSDNVTVEYQKNSFAGLEADHIMVMQMLME